MNIRYTKAWAEPNTKHYESLFRKIKDSVDELEGIFVQRNEMINYIEELHAKVNAIFPRDQNKEPSPNEGFGKYDPPKEKITYPHDSGPIKNPISFDRSPKHWYATVRNHTEMFTPLRTLHFHAFTFNEALNEVLKSNHIDDIISLEILNND